MAPVDHGSNTVEFLPDYDEPTMSQDGKSSTKPCWYKNHVCKEMHINRPLKLLLPRERISRQRGKNHWVSKHFFWEISLQANP